MRGKLVKWNEARGFGFIRPDGFDYDVFVHVSGFKNSTHRPSILEVLEFRIQTDARGKHRAMDVVLVSSEGRRNRRTNRQRAGSASGVWRVALALLVIALSTACAGFGLISAWIPAWYVGLSLLTYLFYASDKSAALAGRWRVPEITLQGLALAGGWPGALFAQQRLRHKNRKPSFQIVFWLSVAMNLVVFYFVVRVISFSA